MGFLRGSKFDGGGKLLFQFAVIDQLVVGDAGLAVRGHCPLPVMPRMPSDGGVHRAPEWVWVPLDQRVVDLVDLALPECRLELRVRTLGLRHHHEAGRADVEPVDDPLPLRGTAGRHAVSRRREPSDHRRSAPAGTGVSRDPDRLVDDHDVDVVVDHAHPGHRLRGGRGLHRGEGDLQPGAGDQPVGLGRRSPVQAHGAPRDQLRRLAARDAEQPTQPGVDPLPLEPFRHREGPGRAGRRSRIQWEIARPGHIPSTVPVAVRATRCHVATRRPSRPIPRRDSTTISAAEHTMAESATLKTGKFGTWIQSTT